MHRLGFLKIHLKMLTIDYKCESSSMIMHIRNRSRRGINKSLLSQYEHSHCQLTEYREYQDFP